MKTTTKRLTKKDIYKIHGIEFDSKTGKYINLYDFRFIGYTPVNIAEILK